MTTTQSDAARAVFIGNEWRLSLAQLFSGTGKSVGFAVGGLLAEQLTGSAVFAGFAQTASIVGAGLLALPLARLADRRTRRYALTLGFGIAVLGAVTILLGARLSSPVVFFMGMFLFGAATATALQTRYAATDVAPPHLRGTALSIVVWAATVGSVAGPNLAGPGGWIGPTLQVSALAGPFALAALAFVLAMAATAGLRTLTHTRSDRVSAASSAHDALPTDLTPGGEALSGSASATKAAGADHATGTRAPAPRPSAPAASAAPATSSVRHSIGMIVALPHALQGFAAIIVGHTIMVSVMVMTPIHMGHSGDTIAVIGIVISLHVMGMYALSPVFGWLADHIGAVPVIWTGYALFAASAVIGVADDQFGSTVPRISVALTLLGLGWSACFVAGSTLLTQAAPAEHRLTIQGATDAAMNFGAAIFAAAAGPLLALGGFTLINMVALAILAIGVIVGVTSARRQRRFRTRTPS